MLRRPRLLASASVTAITLLLGVPTVALAQTTAAIGLSVSVVPTLRVYSYGSLNFGTVSSSTADQTLSQAPSLQGTSFQIVGEINRVVAISCPASVTLIDPAQSAVNGPIFTPKFALFTAAGQQSTYVRGAGGCPSVTLQPVVNEGQMVLALGGDLLIPQNYAGNFSGTYTISIAYP